jgi:hypothetical protein
MRDEEDEATDPRKTFHCLKHRFTVGEVKRRRHLVENKDAWVPNKGTRQDNELLRGER